MSVHGGNIEEVARLYKFNPEEIVDFSANINPMGLSENVKKYITFQNPPKALADTYGILLVNKRNKNFDEMFNILGDLFYHINKVILDFNQKINKKE